MFKELCKVLQAAVVFPLLLCCYLDREAYVAQGLVFFGVALGAQKTSKQFGNPGRSLGPIVKEPCKVLHAAVVIALVSQCYLDREAYVARGFDFQGALGAWKALKMGIMLSVACSSGLRIDIVVLS